MYLIAWIDQGTKQWEVVSGEDAMQIRVSELIASGISDDDIIVGLTEEDC